MTDDRPDSECEGHPIKDMILYKLDRTIAILGLVGIAGGAMSFELSDSAEKVVTGVITALAMYIGGKVVKG